MKRANCLLHQIEDIDNLRWAFWKAKKGKNHSREVSKFRNSLDSNLLQLQEQIISGSVEVGSYRFFKVFDPKEREICAAPFRENVLHHALMNICHDRFERSQIFDSYASRKNKGSHAAVAKAQKFSRNNSFYLKLDIQKFFASIHHQVLKIQLLKLFKESRLLNIFDQLIDSYEASSERGVPIGNLSSQYFANHYLTGLDHFIKEDLKIKAYVRYMDDMVLWHNEKMRLKSAENAISEFVEENLKMRLKPIQLNKTIQGLPFLGYRIFPYQLRLTRRSKQRFIQKITQLENDFQNNLLSESDYQRKLLPLLAFISIADTSELRKSLGLAQFGK